MKRAWLLLVPAVAFAAACVPAKSPPPHAPETATVIVNQTGALRTWRTECYSPEGNAQRIGGTIAPGATLSHQWDRVWDRCVSWFQDGEFVYTLTAGERAGPSTEPLFCEFPDLWFCETTVGAP